MTNSEKMDLILLEMQGVKTEMQNMKTEMQDMKTEMQGVKTEMQGMKTEMRLLKDRVTNIEVHLENETDKGIQLLAENFIELTNKLNQAIPAANKNLAYEVKVNYLIGRVNTLEADVDELKVKTGVLLK